MLNCLGKILAPIAAAAVMAGAAGAATISLTPGLQQGANGQTVFVTLQVSGLTAGGPDTLGSFDVDILFDDSVLSFAGYTLLGGLGDPATEQFDLSVGDLGGGVIDLAVDSLLSVAALDALQGTTALLVMLEFMINNLPVGASTTVAVDQNDPFLVLGDAFGDLLAIDDFNNAVIANRDVIPLPGALPLILTGIAGLGFASRRKSAS